ncbi:membrane protein [Kitasatospora phosalacinea]|uniref:Membrane protein n=2 Tax=Kitasatospora phosalacinea TaxID=2065 RepID=A0A9W6QCH2_9ACTN|nr:membrane protein [Kitasatospora phosalacinea]
MPATPTPSDPEGRFRRPDASMSLLTTVMEHSLDDGYAEAARARGAEGSSRLPTTAKGRLVLALGLALATVVVTVGAVNTHAAAPVLAKERDALVSRVNEANAAADALQRQVEEDRDKVEQAQDAALQTGDDGGAAALAAQTGTGEITGPGVKLVIDDASGSGSGGNVSDPRNGGGYGKNGRVKDHDLQYAVNGLWLAGAEAVSVNGQRLTALSAIRAAGDAILVDNRPLVPPYTVLAIGDGPRLARAFQDNEGGHYLKIIQDSYGIRSTLSTQKSLTLPAALGVTLRVAGPEASAEPSPAATPPPPSPSGSSASSAPPSGSPGAARSGTPSKSARSTAKSTSTPTGTGAATP